MNQTVNAEDILDNFSLMVLEEFLVKKKMKDTLETFRNEWKSQHHRPAEDVMLFSWYDVALKLRLPELMAESSTSSASTSSGSSNRTVLESLVKALVKASATKNRRSEEVTVSGLATLPRRTALPPMSTAELEEDLEDEVPSPSMRDSPSKTNNTSMSSKIRSPDEKLKARQSIVSKRSHQDSQLMTRSGRNHSMEAWIPETARMRQFHRDIQNVKEIIYDTKVLEDSLAREMKRLMVSELDRARTEESLDATRKVPCGCCTQLFLKVNLPMKVSRKAILDIRVKWSGKLNSSTVFRGSSIRELVSAMDKKGGKKPPTVDDEGFGSTVPRCYDQVGVCRFCAQFFAEPEDYRPSYQNITFQERKVAHFDLKRREREYWDPLKMLEKDRVKQEEYEKYLQTLEVEQLPKEGV